MNRFYFPLVIATFFVYELKAKDFQDSISQQEMLRHGKEVYITRCIGCHGVKGDGLGSAAPFLNPKPRNFTSGIFKFRSTPTDAVPLDSDLMRTLSLGVLGTSMPSFELLPEISRYAVIQYIKSFSTAFDNLENKKPPVIGAPMDIDKYRDFDEFIKIAEKGKKIFAENCAMCHGPRGIGDGPGGKDLEDDWGFPIKPANLRRAYVKSGRSVRDIYRVLLTGLAGTPMASFKDALSDLELWEVASYVLYLRGEEAEFYGNEFPLSPIKENEI